jgi:hypothetical protein
MGPPDFKPWLPTEGIGMFPYSGILRWKSTLVDVVEGDQDSLADQMSAFIQNSPTAYPFSHTYRLLGPNSNSYTQWVLKKFPESGMKLPWNTIGKNLLIK